MRYVIEPGAMRQFEREYFEGGASSLEAMEQAGTALRDAAGEMCPPGGRVFIACGPGGNGGDGYVCARLLREAGYDVTIFESAKAVQSDARRNARLCRDIPRGTPEGEAVPDLWIDALFGTGMARPAEGAARILIERMNEAPCPVLSADIPSGLDGRSGRAAEVCVRADRTVGFGLAKCGFYLSDGFDVCGRVSVADLGFPAEKLNARAYGLMTPEDLPALFPASRRNVHKGSFGHLLIVAGSLGMAGAAALCAKAALRSGAGLVSVACPESIVPVLQTLVPCAMCIPLAEEDGIISVKALRTLEKAVKGKTAFAAGCGWTRFVPREVPLLLTACSVPAVFDADALNIMADYGVHHCLNEKHIITPHPGEAARLLGKKADDPVRNVRELSRNGCCAVLKGSGRVIGDGKRTLISATGCPGMAKGGSGDVLTGIIGALLAQQPEADHVALAAAACEIHGLAGLLAEEKYSRHGMTAENIIEMLPEVFQRVEDRK